MFPLDSGADVISAGKLDRKLKLFRLTVEDDELGQPVETWKAVAIVPAQRLELRSADVARQGGKVALATGRYLIRYRRNITIGQRVEVDGRAYKVTQIDYPDRRASLILTVGEI